MRTPTLWCAALALPYCPSVGCAPVPRNSVDPVPTVVVIAPTPPASAPALKAPASSQRAPELANAAPLGVSFEGKITLLGVTLTPKERASPGTWIQMKLYWRRDDQVQEGWALYTHVLGAAGERILNLDNLGPLRQWTETGQAMPPSRWEKGKVYVDEQVFQLPEDLSLPEVIVVAGLWKGVQRLQPISGRRDRENHAIVATLKIEGR